MLPEQLEVGNIIRAYHVKLILDKNTQRAKKVIFLLDSSRLDTLEKNIPLTVIGADVAPVDLPRWYDVEAIADPVVKDEDFDARYRTEVINSSGSPIRFNGAL